MILIKIIMDPEEEDKEAIINKGSKCSSNSTSSREIIMIINLKINTKINNNTQVMNIETRIQEEEIRGDSLEEEVARSFRGEEVLS